MKSKETDISRLFFRNHEMKQNSILLKAVRWFLILIPIVALPKILGTKIALYEHLHWKLIFEIAPVFVGGVLISTLIYHFKPYSQVIKYILLFTIELDIFLISIDKTFDLFISFVLVPFISCLYLDKKFTLKVSIGCYIIMIISIFIRAFYVNTTFERFDNAKYWVTAYSIGLSIEYLVNMILVLAITSRYSSVVQQDYETVYKHSNTQNTITKSYVGMLSQKDPGIEEHLERCSEYVSLICSQLQLSKKYGVMLDDEMRGCIVTGALLHDIGVIAIPDEILKKEDELTKEERRILNTHPIQGEKLIRENLRGIKRNYLMVASDMALCHHENWDGTGFPNKLKGEEIPLSGRIMAVANTMDSLLTDYPYRKRLEFAEALKAMREMAGKQLDPEIVECFLTAEDDIYRISHN